MKCEHLDYDQYFEKCPDCGLSGEQIHTTECVPEGKWELTDEGLCDQCGTFMEGKA